MTTPRTLPTLRSPRLRSLRRRVVLGTAALIGAGTAGWLPAPALAAPAPAAASGTVHEAHVANPYAGAAGYVNPEWRANAEREPGGDRVANIPTGIWLDRIARIEGSSGARGLRAHLDTALEQRATVVQVVLDDLPGRDCTRLGFDGDFGPDQAARYQHEFVDPIVAIESDPKYGSLRIVNVVEVDALAELLIGTRTGYSDERCLAVQRSSAYVQDIQYAIDALHPFSNLYTYLGIAHHGRLGWDTVFYPAAQLIQQTVKGTKTGLSGVDGFISNTAGYSALKEPFFTATTVVNGINVRQTKWVDWNPYIDELPFAQAFRNELIKLGFDPGIGMLIDTSRNGWGGPARPTRTSTSTDPDSFVNESRIDRRHVADNWCNQAGAGLGERPVANPAAGIDAYVWMKAPGTSDGASTWTSDTADDALDPMCNPTYSAPRGSPPPTDALSGAPARGQWFSAQFRQLMANAYPPLP